MESCVQYSMSVSELVRYLRAARSYYVSHPSKKSRFYLYDIDCFIDCLQSDLEYDQLHITSTDLPF